MDKSSFCLFLFLCLTIVGQSQAARILAVYPVPCLSHHIFFRTLTDELVRRGHEVVVITTDPAYPKGETVTNLTEIDVHDISYKTWKKNFWTAPTGRRQGVFAEMSVGFITMIDVFEDQLRTKQVHELINDKSRKFDLLLLESCIRLPLVFTWIYKAPAILISSFGSAYGTFEIVGAPVHALFYSSNLRQTTYNPTYWETVLEIGNHYFINYDYTNLEKAENEMILRNFGPNIPSLSELQENVEMFMLNMYREWDLNRPVPGSVVYMGGLHNVLDKEMPQDLKSFLDSSVYGVIYMSFGTNLIPSKLPPERIQMFVNVFSQLPYDILWKWDKDELPGQPKNIKIAKWIPQMDVLRHSKIKLFITQGGLQSTDEAINAGVPVIGIPMLADQWFNTEKYVHYGFGNVLELESLTEKVLKDAIENVIGNKSFRQNLMKHRSLLYDQPQRPLERAVWWTEHVLRHGGAKHLRAPAANMPWVEYLELELVLLLLAISLIFIIALISFVFWIVRD